ncbi:MAG: UvrD-helicase domain-containing protein [Acidimicrobiia bacterium]
MRLSEAPSNVYLPACPGAGKTRQVVERFLARTSEVSRKGVALLSFSNSAVDEATSRCGGRLEVLRAPNFVGTFDSFIHRFVTTPYMTGRGVQPEYRDQWGDLDRTTVALPGAYNYRYPLELFDFTADGTCTLDVTRPGMRPGERRYAVSKNASLCAEAATLWRRLVKAGFVSCSAARAIAKGLVEEPDSRDRIGSRLASRFSEIIVDEMQDCGPDELSILTLAHQKKVGVVMVADIDQAIYEFRNAVPDKVLEFAGTLSSLPGLMKNHRSTPEISAINTSLRHGREVEVSMNPSRGVPVCVLATDDPVRVRDLFCGLLQKHEIGKHDAVVLSHRLSDAEVVAGTRTSSATTNDRVATMAICLRDSLDPVSLPRTKLRAKRRFESALLSLLGFGPMGSVDEQLRLAGVERRWFARLVARLISSLKGKGDRSDFASTLKDSLGGLAWPSGDQIDTAGIRKPSAKSWQAVDARPVIRGALRATTVHSVKGQEFRAVLLAIRRPRSDQSGLTVLDHWEQDLPTEERRVLYVGASRPAELLVLAIPASARGQVIRILTDTAVPFIEVT